MKKYFVIICVFVLGISSFMSGCATTGVSGLKLPDYGDKRLKSGASLLVIRDKSLPYFSIGALAAVGSRHDPLGKSGLNYLTAGLLERGSKKLDALQLAEAFAGYGTSFNYRADQDYSFFSTQGLSEHQSELIKLFIDVLREPSFTIEEVERRKKETVAAIRRGYDNPAFVAGRAFAQFLYGVHPYSRSVSGTERDVSGIRQKDVIRHYLQYYRPSQLSLVLVGDVSDETVKQLDKLMADWEDRTLELKAPSAMPASPSASIVLVNKADLKQSEVRIGHIGVKRNDPDYLALNVATTILSGGFNSRLMKEIRVARGLTYGMRADFDGRIEPGPFAIAANTRHEKVGELITETVKVVKAMVDGGVTAQELKEAQGFMTGRFAMAVEAPEDVARSLLLLRYYGIEDDYLTKYVKNLNKLDVEDVNAAIRKHFHPDQLKIVVYGPQSKVINQLRPLGAIEVREYRDVY